MIGNRRAYNRIILLVLTLLVAADPAWAQVTVERSKEKVVISGTTYYLHIVKKGETLYSISRAYGVTPDELTRENPPALEGLKEGQSLRIPERMVTEAQAEYSQEESMIRRDEARFIYHRLQPGQTVYSLSRMYSVSENEIVQSNPGIDINKLPLGYEIAIPRKKLMNDKESFAGQTTRQYYHRVVRGETMTSIARHYGITVRDLRRENRNIRFPQVGDFLRIPGRTVAETIPEQVAETDSLTISDEAFVPLERPAGYTPVGRMSGSFNIAVMLPFYLAENSKRSEIDSSKSVKGKKIYRVINRRDDWVYPRSIGFVEMYQGMLLAADTLRSLGISLSFHVYDITNDTSQVIRLIRSGVLDNMDLIIGPVHSSNLAIVASYAGGMGIPVISPVQLTGNAVLENHPTLFMANSSLEVVNERLAKKMGEYSSSNFVMIHSGLDEERQETTAFRNMILNELGGKMPFEEIRLREMVFYSRSVLGKDSINRLAHALSDFSKNIVVIASEDPPVMSESITDVHALARKYDLSVFGYPAWRYLDNIDHKVCFDLGLMVYSPYWIDFSDRDIIEFNKDFRNKFLTQPSEISYAWQGYDILFYFLTGLAIHGREFILHPEVHNPDLLHTEFDYRRNDINSGFENHKLYLIRYSNNYELELVKEDVADPGIQ